MYDSDVEVANAFVKKYDILKKEISKKIVGQEAVIEQVLISIFSNGHVLLVGVPGLAKTLLINTIADCMGLSFNRIQFTPDLMPSDIIGAEILDESRKFKFIKGPVFANVILADEINRTPPKTQAALLEAMQEKSVTVAGQNYNLNKPFFVLATQNPIEQEGTYPLPEAQLDRFFFKLIVEYPELSEEISILKRFKNDFSGKLSQKEVKAVVKPKNLKKAMEMVEDVVIKDELLDYIAKIIQDTRISQDLFLGASPRASLAIMKASKAMAALNGRNYVTPDDIRAVTFHVLNHRIILTPEREMEGVSSREVIENIIKRTEVPR